VVTVKQGLISTVRCQPANAVTADTGRLPPPWGSSILFAAIHESRHHFGLDIGPLGGKPNAGRDDGKTDPLERDALKGHYS
jgi:hypothetical protein